MGDRSNVFFRNGASGVGVYAHWGGLAMAGAAAAVLTSKPFKARLGDPSYATRIAVQTALHALASSAADETGFGLWTSATGPDDNEYPFVVIDVGSGECFVARAWNDVHPYERVDDPTVERIAARMQATVDVRHPPAASREPKRAKPAKAKAKVNPAKAKRATAKRAR